MRQAQIQKLDELWKKVGKRQDYGHAVGAGPPIQVMSDEFRELIDILMMDLEDESGGARRRTRPR